MTVTLHQPNGRVKIARRPGIPQQLHHVQAAMLGSALDGNAAFLERGRCVDVGAAG